MPLPKSYQYPKSVLVGDCTYKVRFSRLIDRDKECVGLCNFDTKTITIKKGQSDVERFKTFVHEVLHAIEMEHKIAIKHKEVYKLEQCIVEFLLVNFQIE